MKNIDLHFYKDDYGYIEELLLRLKLFNNIKYKVIKGKYISLYITIYSDIKETQENLSVLIASCILKIHKTCFFEYNIKLPKTLKACSNALIKSLVSFDFENELFYLSNLIEREKIIYVDSYYVFRLQKLQMKWSEFATVANLSTRIDYNVDLYIEFLRFLANNTEDNYSEINIYIKNNAYLLCDNNQKVVNIVESIKDTITLVTILVNLSPRIINIHNFSNINRDTFKSLYYIFSTKINMLV